MRGTRFVLPIVAVCVLAASASARELAAAVVRFGSSADVARVAAAMTSELQSAGYRASPLDAAELGKAGSLTREQFDLIALPDAGTLPADALPVIDQFLRAGGNIIALQTPLGQKPVVRVDGSWVTREEYCRTHAADLPENVVMPWAEGDCAKWQRNSSHRENGATHETIAEGPAAGRRALHVILKNLQGWDTYLSPKLADPFPEGRTLTIFAAKGTSRTDQLAVEWQEKDGSRWIAVVPLAPEWRLIVLEPSDFKIYPFTSHRANRQPFNPCDAANLSFGIAYSHTGQVPGRHEYWVGPVATAKVTPDYARILQAFNRPRLDTLSPDYKLFDCTGVASLSAAVEQLIVPQGSFALPAQLRSPQPRAQAHGFAKGRSWRWIPLVEARTAAGDWRGTPATLMAHFDGPFKGGAWASFGVADAKWYTSPEAIQTIGQVARRMRDGVYIVDGGSNYYTYFDDQAMTLGLTAANISNAARSDLTARITVEDGSTSTVAYTREWPLTLAAGETKAVSEEWKPSYWPTAGFRVTAQLLAGGKPFDRVQHTTYVWRPNRERHFVIAREGHFQLDGRPWRAHGVNYMPSSGIGTEDGKYFEYWLGARSYDPEVIQRDLDHLHELGFNAVSIFLEHANMRDQNLLDLLRRLELLGMKANLSLRPANPMNFKWEPVRDMLAYYRMAEQDTVFGLDLAWEPMFRGHDERKYWDREWESWILERYGSVEAAEKDWDYKIPRDDKGAVTNPLPNHIDTDGPWRRMVAAYRRCLDTLLYRHHAAARRLVRSIDPNHFVSFRMTEAGNPTFRMAGWMPYDFPYLAAGVDMLAPEAYGRIGDWEQVKPAVFEVSYARWAAPDKPVIWAEAGSTVWDVTHDISAAPRLQFQAELYRDLYRMLTESESDGIFFWWYPGGFRVGEDSDFGIINPDGSDRPVTRVIRDYAPGYWKGRATSRPSVEIEFDRDAHPDGISGAYDAVKDAYWKARADGRVPTLKTAGTGTNSVNCPLLAVGNTPCNGSNPPKYLDAAFDLVEMLGPDGKWVAVEKGSKVEVPAGKSLTLRIEVTNLGEAAWVSGSIVSSRSGPVFLLAECAPGDPSITALPSGVAHFGTVSFENLQLPSAGVSKPTRVTLVMESVGRTRFGERFAFEVDPK